MEYSEKEGCRILVEVLAAKGVKRVVLSPGSRNAPLIVSFARCDKFEKFIVLDERSAAFMALGMSQQTEEPVALVCTSGTALLNYAPAVAEAYYQRIPLIIISADRPPEWIDQDDSQTIRQFGIFGNFVRSSYILPAEITCDDERWYVNRIVNDAINTALQRVKGPVHIDVPLREPLYGVKEYNTCMSERIISHFGSEECLSADTMNAFASYFNRTEKVLILASFSSPDKTLNNVLSILSKKDNVVVFTETISNLSSSGFIPTIDRVLSAMTDEEKKAFSPDLLITFGGSLVSRMVKKWLRDNPPKEHWNLNSDKHFVDTMKCLSSQISILPSSFFTGLRPLLTVTKSNYAIKWEEIRSRAARSHNKYISEIPWCDLKAFSILLPLLPSGVRLQLSNSTPVRYAQLFEYSQIERCDSNRGTSGIDGATSTAVGAAAVTPGVTVFITGDMGFLYDSNALWNRYISPRLKIIVMCNGGGSIFRFIPGPSELPELESYFETHRDVDVEGLASLNGFKFFKADSETSLKSVLPAFFDEKEKPVILAIETPRELNAEILRGYFKRNQ